ncbi:hypothetical protein J7J90_03520 [Candidatus Micrarchaeota archaeon]|nr:hypothetical protein [Candidatus Micrarchaeota archaeon]
MVNKAMYKGMLFLSILVLLLLNGCVSEFNMCGQSKMLTDAWAKNEYITKNFSQYENRCQGHGCYAYICEPGGGIFGLGSLFSGGELKESSCSLIAVQDVYDPKTLDDWLDDNYKCDGVWECFTANPPDMRNVRIFMLGSGYTFTENAIMNAGEDIPMETVRGPLPDRFCNIINVYLEMNESGYSNPRCDVYGYSIPRCDVYNHTPATYNNIAVQFLPVGSDGHLAAKPSPLVVKKYLKRGAIPVYAVPYDWWGSATYDQQVEHIHSLTKAVETVNNEMNRSRFSTWLYPYKGVGPMMIVIGPGIEFNANNMTKAYCYLRSLAVNLKRACPTCIITVHVPLDTVKSSDNLLANYSDVDDIMKILAPNSSAASPEVNDMISTCQRYHYPNITEKCEPNHIQSKYLSSPSESLCVDSIATTENYQMKYNNSGDCNPYIQLFNVLDMAEHIKDTRGKPLLVFNTGGYPGGRCNYSKDDIREFNKAWLDAVGPMSVKGVMGLVMPSMSLPSGFLDSAVSDGYSVYNPYYDLAHEQGMFAWNGTVYDYSVPVIKGYKVFWSGKDAQSGLLMPKESGAMGCKFMFRDISRYVENDDVVNWSYNVTQWHIIPKRSDNDYLTSTTGIEPMLDDVGDAKDKCDGTTYKLKNLEKTVNSDAVDFDTLFDKYNQTSFDMWPMYQSASVYGVDPWMLWAVYMQSHDTSRFNPKDFNQWLRDNPDKVYNLFKAHDKAENMASSAWASWYETEMVEDNDRYFVKIKDIEDYDWSVAYLTFCEYYHDGCLEDLHDDYPWSSDCLCSNPNDNTIIIYLVDSVLATGEGRCESPGQLGATDVRKAFTWYVKATEEY